MDIWINVLSWLYKPQRYKPTPARRTAPASVSPGAQLEDWEQILYLGFVDRRRSPRSAGTTSVALAEATVTNHRGALAKSPEIIESSDIGAATEGRYSVTVAATDPIVLGAPDATAGTEGRSR
jgi:hypothetical protein